MTSTSKLIRGGLCFIILSFLLTACKTTQSVSTVAPRQAKEVLDSLNIRYIEYSFFTASARMKYNGEESKIGGRMKIIMQPDSLVWMNFKKFSIEGARVLIRADSVKILYRQEDVYETRSTQAYFDHYNIDLSFRSLQELMIGNLPIPKEEDIDKYHTDQYYNIGFNHEGGNYQYMINEDFSIFRASITDSAGRQIIATFGDYDDRMFAKRKDIEITTPGNGTSKISMKLSDVVFDTPKSIKFDIPSHYTRLP